MTLLDIAVQYHIRCELYDRIICSGKSERGSAIPVDNWERIKVTMNATRELIMAVQLAAAEEHRTRREVEEAIRLEPVHREAERILKGIPYGNEPRTSIPHTI